MSETGLTSPVEFASLLEDGYRRIGERSMRDLPVYNDALAVEAVGFKCQGEALTGILITPWFMNLLVWPLDGSPASWRPGSSISHVFPVGVIDFNVGDIEGIGRIASCSLFSPMFEFGTMEQARATAEAVLVEILLPAAEHQRPATKLASSVDRRSFLRGELAEPRP
jgi:[NiFe] hydrogenase assembly HybE family chaperone